MKVEASHLLSHPQEAVWEALFDTAVLARLMPGVQSFEQVSEDEFDAVVEVGVPSVKGTYNLKITIEDKKPIDSYRLVGKGKGKQGWVKGAADLHLAAEDGGTRVTGSADIQIGGRIAGVGQRVIEGVAKAMVGEVLQSLDAEMSGRAPAESPGPIAMLLRVLRTWLRGLFAKGAAKAD